MTLGIMMLAAASPVFALFAIIWLAQEWDLARYNASIIFRDRSHERTLP